MNREAIKCPRNVYGMISWINFYYLCKACLKSVQKDCHIPGLDLHLCEFVCFEARVVPLILDLASLGFWLGNGFLVPITYFISVIYCVCFTLIHFIQMYIILCKLSLLRFYDMTLF